ncbi:hypothetical protein ACFV4N_16185 [Actinosynnema sp. NPDC059797]
MKNSIRSEIGIFESIVGAVVGRCPYGLLVVADRDSVDSHGDWDPAVEIVHAGTDSLYIGVQDAAMGMIMVIVAEGGSMSSGASLLHEGVHGFPSLSLHLYEPDESFSLVIPVDGGVNMVKIYGNATKAPSEIVVLIGGVDAE